MDLKYHGRNRQELARYTGAMDQLAGIKLLEAGDGLERGRPVDIVMIRI